MGTTIHNREVFTATTNAGLMKVLQISIIFTIYWERHQATSPSVGMQFSTLLLMKQNIIDILLNCKYNLTNSILNIFFNIYKFFLYPLG